MTVPFAVVVRIFETDANAVEPGFAMGAADPSLAIGSSAFTGRRCWLPWSGASGTVELGLIDGLRSWPLGF